MNRLIMLAVMVICMVGMVLPVAAQETEGAKPKKEKREKAPKAKKPKPELQEVAVSGIITKVEKKDKNDKVKVDYILTDTEGNKIRLPQANAPKNKKAKGEAQVIQLDDFLNVGVKVFGQGFKVTRKDKETVRFKTISRIEKGGDVAEIEVFPEGAEEKDVE